MAPSGAFFPWLPCMYSGYVYIAGSLGAICFLVHPLQKIQNNFLCRCFEQAVWLSHVAVLRCLDCFFRVALFIFIVVEFPAQLVVEQMCQLQPVGLSSYGEVTSWSHAFGFRIRHSV